MRGGLAGSLRRAHVNEQVYQESMKFRKKMNGGRAESSQGVSKVHTTVIQKSWIEKNLSADMHAEEKVIGKDH
jgi:hypothetical protein